jgi:hypothetical protein
VRFNLRARKIQLSENDVEKQLIGILGRHGYRAERLHAGTAKTLDGRFWQLHPTGTPDYVAVHGTRPSFYLEVKRPGKKPSAEQERKHMELKLQKQNVVTIDSVEALQAWLELHGRSP